WEPGPPPATGLRVGHRELLVHTHKLGPLVGAAVPALAVVALPVARAAAGIASAAACPRCLGGAGAAQSRSGVVVRYVWPGRGAATEIVEGVREERDHRDTSCA